MHGGTGAPEWRVLSGIYFEDAEPVAAGVNIFVLSDFPRVSMAAHQYCDPLSATTRKNIRNFFAGRKLDD
jgi:hypothetical protein